MNHTLPREILLPDDLDLLLFEVLSLVTLLLSPLVMVFEVDLVLREEGTSAVGDKWW